MKINLPYQVENIITCLEQNGFEAYAVGGCVRDSLLGAEPNDWDVTTSASPEKAERCLQNYKVIETGIKHGTITVVADSMPVEITTYRIDGEYSDNRHPDKVEFTKNLREDLARRDFTINAMAYSNSSGIIDCFGGMDDLKRKVVRCVGDSGRRFNEDGLRILRALRFASVLGFSIEDETSKQINGNKGLLDGIARERVREEFTKLLCGKNAVSILNNYRDVIAVFIPEIKACFGFKQNNPHHIYDVWEHILKATENIEPEPVLRLTMFFHDIGKPRCYTEGQNGVGHFYGHADISAGIAHSVLKRLRYSRKFSETVTALVKLHSIPVAADEKTVKRRLNKIGEENFRLLLKVKTADTKAKSQICFDQLGVLKETEKTLDNITREKKCFTQNELAVNGFDLMSYGIPQGKEIGKMLRALLNAVIDGKCENTREELLSYAEKLKKQ